jgi:hypothetical protein
MKFEKNSGILYSSTLIPNVKSSSKVHLLISVGDPADPDPQDQHVFWLRILPLSHKCLERTEIMLDNIEF